MPLVAYVHYTTATVKENDCYVFQHNENTEKYLSCPTLQLRSDRNIPVNLPTKNISQQETKSSKVHIVTKRFQINLLFQDLFDNTAQIFTLCRNLLIFT